MGYECPVCSTPQADARHLANHMAMTAMLGRGSERSEDPERASGAAASHADHADWLDEHTPGWNEAGEKELAPRVAEHAEEKAFPQVFEDTVGGLEESEDPDDPLEERGGALFEEVPHGHDHGGGHTHQHTPQEAHLAGEGVDAENLDDEARAAIEEAREMTRAMLEGERSEPSGRASGSERSERHASDEDEEAAADDDSEGDRREPSEASGETVSGDNNA